MHAHVSLGRFGETGLHKIARFVGQDPRAAAVMENLVKAGADPNIAGAHGTALELIQECHRHLVADFMPVGTALKEVLSGSSHSPVVESSALPSHLVPCA